MRGAVFICLWLCAGLNCAGWALSALHELNVAGYSAALALGLVAWRVWRKRTAAIIIPRIPWQKLRRRFLRPLPALFLVVTVLVFLGGIMYSPTNFDALTYRLPRGLNWLAEGKWVWIPTINQRMNCTTVGWEWVALPQLLLRTDRLLFLINALGFLLLPGLLFSVFRQVGIARKVAWLWMWLLPLAYGYATQAGSVGNDLMGTLFCLMSVDYGLRARRSRRVEDVWPAGLSAALMTAVKLSNLPLLLPCLVAVWPALGCLRQRWASSLAMAGIATLSSAAPTVALNWTHTGSWDGDPKNVFQARVKSPRTALLGNGLLLFEQSFMPPVLPEAHKLDDWLNANLPASWSRTLKEGFPRYYLSHLNELPQEEGAGLGLGITMLLLTAVGASFGKRVAAGAKRTLMSGVPLVGLAAWVSTLFYLAKMGSEAAPRLLLPYYPLVLLPLLALPAQERLGRCRAWRVLAVVAALGVLPPLVLSPSRPLWPAISTADAWIRHHPESRTAQRLAMVYSTYAQRNDLLAPLRAGVPDDVRDIGFVAGFNDASYSLWRPLGWRRVHDLRSDRHPSLVVPPDIDWIVVNRAIWPEASNLSLEEWAAQHQAKIVASVPIVSVVSKGPETWCLLEVLGH